MTREELIEFAMWLDEGTDYFGKSYIEVKTDEWLGIKAKNIAAKPVLADSFHGRDADDAANIEEAKKIWNDQSRATRKLDAVKFLMTKQWGLKQAHDYCRENFG